MATGGRENGSAQAIIFDDDSFSLAMRTLRNRSLFDSAAFASENFPLSV